MPTANEIAQSNYRRRLAKRLGGLSLAMCRLCGIEHGLPSCRMDGPEDNDACHDLYDAVQNRPRAAALLDWLLSLAARDMDNAIREAFEPEANDADR